jgi:hypothetical protein
MILCSFSGLDHYSVSYFLTQSVVLLGQEISQPQRQLHSYKNNYTWTPMPPVGFEPTVLGFQLKKIFRVIESVVNVIGYVG